MIREQLQVRFKILQELAKDRYLTENENREFELLQFQLLIFAEQERMLKDNERSQSLHSPTSD